MSAPSLQPVLKAGVYGNILTMSPEALAKIRRFDLVEVEDEFKGRISVYEKPRPDRTYVIGADFALGLQERDYEAACVLDITQRPRRQVGELQGHWGQDFDRVLYAAICYWNTAFLLGEQQFGLHVMQRLYRFYGCTWMYYNRDESVRTRPLTQKLGRVKSGPRAQDPLLTAARVAVRHREDIIRSRQLLEQMTRLQYSVKKTLEPEEATSSDLDVKLVGGGSPDLVIAYMNAVHAAGEIHHYPKPKPEGPTQGFVGGGDLPPEKAADDMGHPEGGKSWKPPYMRR